MHIMNCAICLEVEHKDKLLAPKWDLLQKHANWKKMNKPMRKVKKRKWYTYKDCKYNKNEIIYVSKGREFVLQQQVG